MSKDSGYTARLVSRRYTVEVEGYSGPELTGERHIVHIAIPSYRESRLYLYEEGSRYEDEAENKGSLNTDVLINLAKDFVIKHYGEK